MARRKRRQGKPAPSIERVHPHEAVILFQRLRELGHIGQGHIAEARRSVAREVDEITARLSTLKELAHASAVSRKPVAAAEEAPQVRRAARRKRRAIRAPLSAERKKIMQLQGRYLGLMHKVPKAELAKFKADIGKVGKAEVVKRMETYVRKHEGKKSKM